MNSEVKQKWITALRSGEYKQGTRCLHNIDNEFCCLGVLCDIYLREHQKSWQLHPSKPKYFLTENDAEFASVQTSYLPEVVRIWAGIDSYDPLSLSCDNDQGRSFEEIANKIEAKL